ncbi:hypothetical protein C8R46DRAFT_1351507 [Mycena filopes]|nr:hypothetical protein C8R46DRAFT_1351507 [Mycena filopes]
MPSLCDLVKRDQLGSAHAPVFIDGRVVPTANLIFNPTGTVWASRYERLQVDKALEPLLSGVDVQNILRPLSYAINLSPVIVFGVLDLSTKFIDLQLQQQINHVLSAAGPAPPALACMEQRIYKFIRSNPAGSVAEAFHAANASGFAQDMPPRTPLDTARFVEFKARFLTPRRGALLKEAKEKEENLLMQVETLTQNLAQERLRSSFALEESERRHRIATFEHCLEGASSTILRVAKDIEAATRQHEELADRHAQANERIQELERERSKREAEIATMRERLSQFETRLSSGLSILAASIKEISNGLEPV